LLAGYAGLDAPRDVVCPPGCQGTLLAPIEVPFCRTAL